MRVQKLLIVTACLFLAPLHSSAEEPPRRYNSIYGGQGAPDSSEAIVTFIESCIYDRDGNPRPGQNARQMLKYCGCLSDAFRGGILREDDFTKLSAKLEKSVTVCMKNARRYQGRNNPTPSPYQPKDGDWTAERIFLAYRGGEKNLLSRFPSLPVGQRLDIQACMVDHLRKGLVQLGFTEKKIQQLGPENGYAAMSQVMPEAEQKAVTACAYLIP
jgi:hypothetical protein